MFKSPLVESKPSTCKSSTASKYKSFRICPDNVPDSSTSIESELVPTESNCSLKLSARIFVRPNIPTSLPSSKILPLKDTLPLAKTPSIVKTVASLKICRSPLARAVSSPVKSMRNGFTAAPRSPPEASRVRWSASTLRSSLFAALKIPAAVLMLTFSRLVSSPLAIKSMFRSSSEPRKISFPALIFKIPEASISTSSRTVSLMKLNSSASTILSPSGSDQSDSSPSSTTWLPLASLKIWKVRSSDSAVSSAIRKSSSDMFATSTNPSPSESGTRMVSTPSLDCPTRPETITVTLRPLIFGSSTNNCVSAVGFTTLVESPQSNWSSVMVNSAVRVAASAVPSW